MKHSIVSTVLIGLLLTLSAAEPAAPVRALQGATAPAATTTLTIRLPLIAASAPAPPGGGQRFETRPPGTSLPGDAECAAAVTRRPENKRMNAGANATRGSQSLPAEFFAGDDPRAGLEIAPRVTGNFSGTTDEILQWVACKWGIDEDIVRAQAVKESWWRQTALGDWTTDPTRCAPGRGLGADGRPGECPESFGILQDRYPYEQAAWPGIVESTAFNADTAYAIWRACYEGYEVWLNQVEHGQPYGAGDAWGCIGRWASGRWHTPAGDSYVAAVRSILSARTWERPEFQEP